ncbi:unnamed protein product [Brassica oleracea var. botrytis]|uniref:Uncharacterized protein n=1 Tax=Brassica oleracea TaxID=3712 RepID=A0A3P6CP36_BRAOL|nr:unnamed protein product [Brassica oleracea]
MSGRGDHRHRISASEILWFLCFDPVSVSGTPRHCHVGSFVAYECCWHIIMRIFWWVTGIRKTLSFNYENKNLRKKLVAEEHEIHCLWPLD